MLSFATCSPLESSLLFFFLMIRRPPRSTLSLHDALPICRDGRRVEVLRPDCPVVGGRRLQPARSEEHTSELQSLAYLVLRLLLENNIAWGIRAATLATTRRTRVARTSNTHR